MAGLALVTLKKTLTLGLGGLAVLGLVIPASAQQITPPPPVLGSLTVDQVYTPVTPCRFVDGINAADRVSSAAGGTTARYYRVRGSTGTDFVSQGAAGSAPTGCGVPSTATAVMVNLTVADPDADGDLRVDPADASTPSTTSVLNYTFGGARGKNLANGVVVKLCDLTIGACASGATPTTPTRDILVTFHAGASIVSTYFIADVLGYFAPAAGFATSCTTVTSGPLPGTFLNNFFTTITATCPAGKYALSGGYTAQNWNTVNTCIPITNARTNAGTGWTVLWGAATASVCAGHSSVTSVLCCP